MTDGMLASDSEREAVVARLRAAHLEGRLDAEGLEERVAAATGARTLGELATLTADLPEPTVAGADLQLTTGVPVLPGARTFVERKLLSGRPAVVRAGVVETVVPALERHGFRVREETDELVRLSGRQFDELTVRLRDAGDGRTLVVVHGVAPLRVRQAFARLRD